MLAHHQGGLLNVAQLARNLGVDGKTALSYTDLLCDLLLLRRLAPGTPTPASAWSRHPRCMCATVVWCMRC